MTNKLNVTTPTDLEIVITRAFDAPRSMVWQAMSEPRLIKQWLFGPPGWSMEVCEDEQRVGGQFRWAWNGPDGAQMSMHGVYREVTPPERIVRTEIFETGCDATGGEQLSTLVLNEAGDRTNLTLTVLYSSKEARDGALASGMERGVEAGYDRLEAMLTAKAATQS